MQIQSYQQCPIEASLKFPRGNWKHDCDFDQQKKTKRTTLNHFNIAAEVQSTGTHEKTQNQNASN
jgi:hypothetical protein